MLWSVPASVVLREVVPLAYIRLWAGKVNGHLGQGGALEGTRVVAEDVRKGWQHRTMYQ